MKQKHFSKLHRHTPNIMQVLQQKFFNGQWQVLSQSPRFDAGQCQLVLAFGHRDRLANPAVYEQLKKEFPKAQVALLSTSGEIIQNEILDDTIVVSALHLEKNEVKAGRINIKDYPNSFEAGQALISKLPTEKLRSVLVLSDGLLINGSELVEGLNSLQMPDVPITGGLAGDSMEFSHTLVGLNAVPASGEVVAIGFYGDHIRIGHGSIGGWDEFGHEKIITRSEKNVLYEVDHRNALDLYKEYLGDYAKDLPGSAFLFPMSIKIGDSDRPLVRTILSINEKEKSMTFAGNLPEGSKVRLMKANFDKLIEGSAEAAQISKSQPGLELPEFALLISCVGRKIVLQERTDEEVEASVDVLNSGTHIMGFYSYGEICPFNQFSKCELHNQTMTITTITEL